jgi:hypothetical protein
MAAGQIDVTLMPPRFEGVALVAHVEAEIMIQRPVEEVIDFVADERNDPSYNRSTPPNIPRLEDPKTSRSAPSLSAS